MTLYAEVVFALPGDRSYLYTVPAGEVERIAIGARVLAPLGPRSLTGFVIRTRRRRPSGDFEVKALMSVLDDEPVFSPALLKFTRSLSRWFYASWGEMLQAALPPALIVRSRTRFGLKPDRFPESEAEGLAADERRLIALLSRKSYTVSYLRRRFPRLEIGALVQRWEKKGWLERKKELTRSAPPRRPHPSAAAGQLELDFSLDRRSLEAARRMGRILGDRKHACRLLHAAPAPRYAVYLYLLRECADRSRRALVLVPEIDLLRGLGPDLEKKLGERVALLHSRLTPSQRTREWERIRRGDVDVVVGTRSALFAPLDNLGLLIVDEEQDFSHHQRESPSYDARVGARIRARQERALLVYGSEWPTVEAVSRARRGGALIAIPGSRPEGAVEILEDPPLPSLISDRILARMQRRLNSGQEPVLVFCGRRGYASVLTCPRCRSSPRCPRCDVALSYHKQDGSLVCHICGFRRAFSRVCETCGSRIVRSHGPGIEVVVEHLERRFPQSRIARFDRDAEGREPEEERILERFRSGRIDILAGTPVLAHRFRFPPVPMVVIFHPESMLSAPDFQAGQRTANTIRQMMRCWDGGKGGELLVQTAFPGHHGIRSPARDRYEDFWAHEIQYRRGLSLPPFTHMAEIIFQGKTLRSLAGKTRDFTAWVEATGEEAEVMGPAIAPVSRIRGLNRVQMIVKAKRKSSLDRAIRGPLNRLRVKRSVLVFH
jgi:primosomal protein N' (replication factor Y)